jgi:hypothetical protein
MKKDRSFYLEELLSPEPLSSIDDLELEIESRPNFVGPGAWIAVAGEGMKEKNGKNLYKSEQINIHLK